MRKYFLIFFTLFSQNSFAEIIYPAQKTKNTLETISQIRIENLNSNNYNTSNQNDKYIASVAKANYIINTRLNNKWFFEMNYRFDQVKEASESNRNYGNEGAYLREMRFGYNDDNMLLFAGKFRPFFGIAWRNGRNDWYDYTSNNQEQFDFNNSRGIWSEYVANNYAQTEKLGVGGVLKAGNAKTIGKYELGFSAFTNDRKNFDNSLINNRTSFSKNDAVPGGTRGLKSFVTSLDVSYDFSRDEKLFYRFSYIDLDINSSRNFSFDAEKIANQKGFSAAMNYQYPFSRDFNLNGLVEYVAMKNVGGNSDISDKYLTTSLVGNIYQNWNVTTSYASRQNKYVNRLGFDQDMAEISAGYRFDKSEFFDSLLLQIGYRNLRNDYKIYENRQNSIGIFARYIKNF